jgi:translation initiation factor 4G
MFSDAKEAASAAAPWLVRNTFRRAVEKNLCSATAFKKESTPAAEILDDIAIDAPQAFNLMAIIL